MAGFNLPFELSNYNRLDQFALLARQNYNLGNVNDWFGAFRGGLYGFYARIHGVVTHYLTVHAWLPTPRNPRETEYHLTSIFFNMDSAIECLTFALNALGNSVAPRSFRDISNKGALKQISPRDILGNPKAKQPRPCLKGYKLVFPLLQSHWLANQKLLSIIVEQHDVSKHRETIYIGGMHRLDPPPGFYESLGIGNNPSARAKFWPMAEIILRKDPKSAPIGRTPQSTSDAILLETIASDFCLFINETGEYAFQDAITHIRLAHKKFLK